MRLISAEEELAPVDDAATVSASVALADALRFPKDPVRYGVALEAFTALPQPARWVVELVVEAELAANAVALRLPSGIRGADNG